MKYQTFMICVNKYLVEQMLNVAYLTRQPFVHAYPNFMEIHTKVADPNVSSIPTVLLIKHAYIINAKILVLEHAASMLFVTLLIIYHLVIANLDIAVIHLLVVILLNNIVSLVVF